MKTLAITNRMNAKWSIYFAFLAVLFLVAVGIAYGAKSEGVLGAEQGAIAGSAVHHVSLKDGAAFPDELVIKVGEQVQFNSNDGRSHNISSGKGNDYGEEHGHDEQGVSSGQFAADEAFLVSFPAPGTYYFHDHYDASAFITVLVYTPEEGV